MNRKLVLAAVGGITVLAVAVLAWRFFGDRSDGGGLTLYGNVDIREVELGFRVSGRLDEMVFEEGDRVEPGAVMARLDGEPYREELAAAEARVASASANLRRLRTGSRPQEIERARAAVREAQAALENARRNLARQRELASRDATSERRLDEALARRDEAAARLAAAEEALSLARDGFREEDIAAGEAELALAEAEAQRARTRLEDTTLVSPAGGVILSRVREPGTILAAGAEVYTLSLDRPVWVRAYVDEPALGRVHPGMKAWVTTDSSDERYEGQIGFISPRAEFTPKNVETEELRTDLVYRLRVVIAEPDQGLRQGMPVTVTLPDATERPARAERREPVGAASTS